MGRERRSSVSGVSSDVGDSEVCRKSASPRSSRRSPSLAFVWKTGEEWRMFHRSAGASGAARRRKEWAGERRRKGVGEERGVWE